MIVTAKALASRIDGRVYGAELTRQDISDAKESGLVIILAASDDQMEFRGALNEEYGGCWNGATFFIDREGWVEPPADQCTGYPGDCPYYQAAVQRHRERSLRIEAVRHSEGNPRWTYKLPDGVPCETFHVKEMFHVKEVDVCRNGKDYCIGVVIPLSAFPE